MTTARALRAHGAVDLALALLYAWLGFGVARGRSLVFDLALGAVCALLAVAGVALLTGLRVGRRLALAASILLLGGCLTAIVLLVAGVAYLRGVYGPLGQGVAWASVIVAALLFELCGLWPVLHLRFLLSADVKRLASPEP